MSSQSMNHRNSRRVTPYRNSESSLQGEPQGEASPYAKANIANRAVHWWMNTIFTKARHGGLKPNDIYRHPPWEGSEAVTDSLCKYWTPYAQRSKVASYTSLFQCILRANVGSFLLVFVFSLAMVILRFVQPLMVSRLVRFYQEGADLSPAETAGYIIMLLLSNMAVVLLYSANEFVKGLVAMRMRTACTGLTFRKLGRAAEAILTGPMEILLFVMLVSYELDTPPAPFVVLTLLVIVLHCLLGTQQGKRRHLAADHTDRRVAMVNEVITAIRVIKMQCWEQPITARARQLRIAESRKLLMADTWMCVNLSISYHTGRTFVYIAAVWSLYYGVQISPESTIRIIGWMKMIEMSVLIALPVFFSVLFDIGASVGRIQEFLLDDDLEVQNQNDICRNPYISMHNAWASWEEDKQTEIFHLAAVTLEADENQLIMICGPVGCGKTSLLLALLGELSLQRGDVRVQGKVAYVSQEPWIVSGTLRYNITMGMPFDEKHYTEVMEMACLLEDIRHMPYKDLSLIGELGLSLSGGQKARVNMARALYRNADIYLIDDPFSAVDAKVGSYMFQSCLRHYLKDKICILVTHHLQYLPHADHIIYMDKGIVVASGSYQDVSSKADLLEYLSEKNHEPSIKKHIMGMPQTTIVKENELIQNDAKDEDAAEVLKEELTGQGHLSPDTLSYYLKAGRAYLILPAAIILLSVSQAAGLYSDWWITHWTLIVRISNNALGSNTTRQPYMTSIHVSNSDFFMIYTMLLVLSMITGVLFAVLACKMASLAANKLYDDMFLVVLRAPMAFFEKQPVGRILNRFSRDMGFIDDMIPFSLTFLSNEFANILGALVYTAIMIPWTVVASVLFLLTLVTIRQYVMPAARDLRRLEANKRSPTFTMLYSYMKGLHVIRAHRLQDHMLNLSCNVIDGHTGAWHMLLASQRWLAVRSDMAAFCCLTLVLIIMPFVPLEGWTSSSFGLALFYLIRLISTTAISTREAADLEIHMMCVERVRQYTQLPQEAPPHTSTRPPPGWPQTGEVQLHHVSVSYPGGPRVLKDVCLNILPAEKIGIVGRTGSGKTTLMMALLRIREPEGHVIIDGIRTSDLGLADIRKNISVIPQDPMLFSGTLRSNIDPFGEYTDKAIQTALTQVELWPTVSTMKHGLDTPMYEGGENLSVGQRQLLCLGRALLKQSKLLIIDEATANVDQRTDVLIQNTLKREFFACTLLNIAHRIHTVIDYNRILVLDQGRVVQCDHAHNLLQDPDGLFVTMVTQAGPAHAVDLRERAQRAFMQTKDDKTIASAYALPMVV